LRACPGAAAGAAAGVSPGLGEGDSPPDRYPQAVPTSGWPVDRPEYRPLTADHEDCGTWGHPI